MTRGDDRLRHDRDGADLVPVEHRRSARAARLHRRPRPAAPRGQDRRRATAASFRSASQGELCTRGYSVMRGYWKDDERTRESIDAAGWMHSGDLATIDAEGYANIVGRVKDMLIRGGENVYPREIEEYLLAPSGDPGRAGVRRSRRRSTARRSAPGSSSGAATRSTRTPCASSAAARSRTTRCRATCASSSSSRSPRPARRRSSRCAAMMAELGVSDEPTALAHPVRRGVVSMIGGRRKLLRRTAAFVPGRWTSAFRSSNPTVVIPLWVGSPSSRPKTAVIGRPLRLQSTGAAVETVAQRQLPQHSVRT